MSERSAIDPTSATVLVADDEVALRSGVRRALAAGGLTVVAEAADMAQALHAARVHSPDVCLLAVDLPGDGIVTAERIRELCPATKIVMLADAHRDEDMFAALRAGADGYLLKATSARRLPDAVRGVLRGEAALPRPLVAKLIAEFRDRGRPRRLPLEVRGEVVELTAREFETLERLRHGGTTTTIAADLHISEVTVRRHLSSVMHKLGVRDRRTAVELVNRLAASGDGTLPPV